MKKKPITVTIGIPAYNEEANICFLINDILNQEQENILLEKIIIFSDGSTDKTSSMVKSFKNKKILLLDNKKREGLAVGENGIIKNTNSDALILLNADIRIKDRKFLEKLTAPVLLDRVDLTSAAVEELEPTTFFEKILFVSTKIKNFSYDEFNNGENVYTCRGLARALSRRLYKKIYFPTSIGEDAYSYFYCISNGFKYAYVKDTGICYKLPDNFQDHLKQSIRFFQSQKLLSTKFGIKFVTSEYSIPKKILINSVGSYLLKQPIYTVLYLLIAIYLKTRSFFYKKIKDTWDLSLSSKSLSN